MSPLLSLLSSETFGADGLAPGDEVRRPIDGAKLKAKPHSRMARLLAADPERAAEARDMTRSTHAVLPKGRNFH